MNTLLNIILFPLRPLCWLMGEHEFGPVVCPSTDAHIMQCPTCRQVIVVPAGHLSGDEGEER